MRTTIVIGILLALFSNNSFAQNYCDISLKQMDEFLSNNSGFAPFIEYSCLEGNPKYVKSALSIFAQNLQKQFDKLENLEKSAKDFKKSKMKEAKEIEDMMIIDIGNNVFQNKKNFYFQKLINISQDIAVKERNFINEIDNMRATGALLEKFVPHLEGDVELVKAKFGYDSIDEVKELKEYLFDYGQDLRDTPLEIQMALDQLKETQKHLTPVWENLKL
ncbi:hypothetical protein ABMA70_13205 [Halobacteriovorax sp. XZX-3]|uniref:hypothetical protein n=1 Tax=unclassified Halobacteriovorax TaxID=2639665 RepID=UPI000CD0AA29|nr:hypothetical protein [Halobacteriovorax sp. DA5]POB13565.1 hypothetical protein C0Z22_10400 [Halobacteriovorax sp. DA5]